MHPACRVKKSAAEPISYDLHPASHETSTLPKEYYNSSTPTALLKTNMPAQHAEKGLSHS